MSSNLGRYRLGSAAAVALILAGCLIALFVPAGLGWDFANFYDAGRRFAAGQYEDLYHHDRLIQGQEPQGDMDFWGLPLSASLFSPLALFGPETALVVFKAQNILALLLGLALLHFHLRPLAGSDAHRLWRFSFWFWLAALLYQPFWTVFRVGGQSTPTVFLLCVLALLAHKQARFGWSSLAMAVAVMIKPGLVFALAVLTVLSPLRFWLCTAVHAVLLASVSLLVFGLDLHLEFADKALAGAGWIPPWKDNSSLYIVPEHLRLWLQGVSARWAPAALGTAIPLIKLAVVATLAGVFWLSRRQPWQDEERRHFTFDLALLFFLLFSQTIWEHYLALLFPFLALLLARREALDRAASRIVLSIIALSVLQNLIVSRFIVARIEVDALPEILLAVAYKSAPLWLVLLLLVRYRDSVFSAYSGLAARRSALSAT